MRVSWIKALYEAALMLGVLTACGVLLNEQDPLWLNTNPHPFWIVIVLVAMRYGNPAGFWTSMACAGLHLFAIASREPGLVESLHLDPAQLAPPVLYVIVGSFIGERIGGEQRRNEYFREQLDKTRESLEQSEGLRTRLEDTYRNLESRLAGETDTITQFFQNARQIESGGQDEIRNNLLNALEDCLGVEEADLWIRESNGSWTSHRRPGTPLPELGRIAARESRTVTARDFFGEQTRPPEAGLLAGPLSWKNQGVDGVVVVTRMPFARFTRRAAMLFEILLDWGSRVLERQGLLDAVSRRDVFDHDLNLTSEVFFRTSATKIHLQARRQGEPCTLLAIVIHGTLPPALHRQLLVVFSVILLRKLRGSDIAAYLRHQNAFLVFLPSASREESVTVQEKLEAEVARLHLEKLLEQGDSHMHFSSREVGPDEAVNDAIHDLLAQIGKADA